MFQKRGGWGVKNNLDYRFQHEQNCSESDSKNYLVQWNFPDDDEFYWINWNQKVLNCQNFVKIENAVVRVSKFRTMPPLATEDNLKLLDTLHRASENGNVKIVQDALVDLDGDIKTVINANIDGVNGEIIFIANNCQFQNFKHL